MTLNNQDISEAQIQYEYATTVEETLREKIGLKDDFHHWVRRLCYANPDFIDYLKGETKNVRHYLAYIKVGLDRNRMLYVEDELLTKIIIKNKRITVLRSVFSIYPTGLLGVIHKTSDAPIPLSLSRQVVEVLSKKRGSREKRKLWCAKEIHYAFLMSYFSLEEELRVLPLVYSLRNPTQAELVNYVVKLTKSYFPEEQHKQIVSSLKNHNEVRDMFVWCKQWLMKASFQGPPWGGDDLIKPICTAPELIRYGMRMQNCMGEYVVKILEGNYYFYIAEQNEKAAICLKKVRLQRWVVHGVYGFNNKSVGEEYEKEILDRFANMGIEKKPIRELSKHLRRFHDDLSEWHNDFNVHLDNEADPLEDLQHVFEQQ